MVLFAYARTKHHYFVMSHQREWMMKTRATLLARLKNSSDHESWQVFFDTYAQLIYSVAVKSRLSKSEAEDVVQATMISVAKHMPGFKYDPKIGSFKAWLLKMTRWRISDQFRKRQKYVVGHADGSETTKYLEYLNIEEIPAASDFERIWEEEWKGNIIEVAVAKARRRLNPKQYQVYDLCVNKGWEAARVAERLSISIDQVYLSKHRMTEAIKAEVDRLQKEIT